MKMKRIKIRKIKIQAMKIMKLQLNVELKQLDVMNQEEISIMIISIILMKMSGLI